MQIYLKVTKNKTKNVVLVILVNNKQNLSHNKFIKI